MSLTLERFRVLVFLRPPSASLRVRCFRGNLSQEHPAQLVAGPRPSEPPGETGAGRGRALGMHSPRVPPKFTSRRLRSGNLLTPRQGPLCPSRYLPRGWSQVTLQEGGESAGGALNWQLRPSGSAGPRSLSRAGLPGSLCCRCVWRPLRGRPGGTRQHSSWPLRLFSSESLCGPVSLRRGPGRQTICTFLSAGLRSLSTPSNLPCLLLPLTVGTSPAASPVERMGL